ncbi:molecular chaperone [Deinococcus cavernae]|uniref:Molecular chaperone n=1 Tax=Deinococcus cavernae TaxID=2320857 RepID=A0A418VEG1_9DEIO|nr:fimbria/pilus periplasmic chaperone [Deinococcus cavernae]RJF74497.1 molecular chaperone [Deinococcus cavernae]
MRKFSFLALLLLLSFGSLASAAKFVLSPVTMSLNPAEALSTSTTLTNGDTVPVEFTAELLLWTQENGKDVLVPTRDAVVSPMRFKVAPGKSQVIRLALRNAPRNPSATYRLILRQQLNAPVATDQKMTITPRYVFSLPLFVERPEARAQVSLTAQRLPGGAQLVFSNSGTGYAVYRSVVVGATEKSVPLGNVYVLPGSTVTLPLPPELLGASTLNFSGVDAAAQEMKVTLHVP